MCSNYQTGGLCHDDNPELRGNCCNGHFTELINYTKILLYPAGPKAWELGLFKRKTYEIQTNLKVDSRISEAIALDFPLKSCQAGLRVITDIHLTRARSGTRLGLKDLA